MTYPNERYRSLFTMLYVFDLDLKSGTRSTVVTFALVFVAAAPNFQLPIIECKSIDRKNTCEDLKCDELTSSWRPLSFVYQKAIIFITCTTSDSEQYFVI